MSKRAPENRPYRVAVLNSHPIQYFAPLYRAIAQERDMDLTVYYCSTMGSEAYLDPGFGVTVQWDRPLLEGYRYHVLRNFRKGDNRGFWGYLNFGIVSALWKGRYDALVIHGHQYAVNLLAFGIAKLRGTKIFVRGENHLSLERPAFRTRVRSVVMRAFLNACDACLVIGTRNSEYYESFGVPKSQCFLLPYAVDNEYFSKRVEEARPTVPSLKAELDLPAEQPVVLYMSKLTERKNPSELLTAFAALRAKGVGASLVFVGTGPEEPMLRERVAVERIPDVAFAGFRNQSELPRFLALADIFALPSVNEPWGLVVNEAMCAGLPVVATNEIGSVRDLVKDGVNGFSFSRHDVDAMARALETLLVDTALRTRFGAQSRDRIATWSYRESVQGLRAALRSTVNASA